MRGCACPDQRAYQIAKSSKSPNAPGGLVNCPLRSAAACPSAVIRARQIAHKVTKLSY
jgi:hypothetical protein